MADPIRAALERLIELNDHPDTECAAWNDAIEAARAALAAAPEATAEESSVPAPAVPALPPGYEAIGPEWQPDALARARATLAAWNALATAPKSGPSESDITELFYRHMGEGSEVGFENAIAEALARWGRQPAPPAEGEVAELVAWLRRQASKWDVIDREAGLTRSLVAEHFTRAAELLEQRHPAPVPVAERLPGDELCWWFEADEDCGYGSNWTLLRIRGGATGYTHWLPATALPLPAGEVQP